MNIPPLMESFFFFNSETSKTSRSTVLSLISQDREVSTQKYQDTLEQARYDNGVIGEHPFSLLF
jgi:hypothetical protein